MKRWSAMLGILVLLGTGGYVVWSVTSTPPAATGNTGAVPVGTAEVTRGTVTQRIRIPGTYGFDGAYTVVHQGGPGIVTTAAAPGAIVERGGVLYGVDNRSVRLLYGDLPSYRDLTIGMSDGADVRQLEQNLVDLGFDPSGQITVDDHFTNATSAAVRRWQVEWGVPAVERTGSVTLGQVVFLPVALRITAVNVGAGSAVAPNEPVLTASSTARVVTAQLGTDRQATVKVGDAVMVSLPSGAPLPGTIQRVGRVATGGGSNGDGGSGGPNGGTGPATITIIVGLTAPTGPTALPDLDQAPVLVAVAANVRSNVLLVPVAALLARPGGGYQVRKPGGTVVEVRPGLFDDATGKVEVTGALEVGDLVEVPVT